MQHKGLLNRKYILSLPTPALYTHQPAYNSDTKVLCSYKYIGNTASSPSSSNPTPQHRIFLEANGIKISVKKAKQQDVQDHAILQDETLGELPTTSWIQNAQGL